MTPASLVSVVMPLYEGERYVEEALDSVLAQTYRPVELLVVDDGSTDGGADLVRAYGGRVELLVQPHAGIGAARNRGVRAAVGEYLAFIDADDRWPPDRLRTLVAVLDGDPQVDAVFGEYQEFLSPELERDQSAVLRGPVSRRPARLTHTMLVRRTSFWSVGPFDEQAGRAVDVDWQARAGDGALVTTTAPVLTVERRLNLWSTGVRSLGKELEYVRALRVTLNRRREESFGSPEA